MSLELNKIYNGNSLDVLKTFPDNFIDCVVTSPPYYGLRDYGVEGQLGLEPTFKEYLAHLIEIFAEVKRILKSSGTVWVNLGDSYSGMKQGNTDLKNTNTNTNSFIKNKQMQDKSLLNIPSRFAIRMTDELGFIQRNEIIWHKRNCLNGSTVLYAKTQKGIIISTLKDLVRLKPETVKLWDGEKWNQVKEWIRNDEPKDIKNITFRNGNKITCTGEHLFPAVYQSEEIKDTILKKASELKTGDIIQNCLLPDNQCNFEYLPNQIGRLIGLYLAEGSLGDKQRCIQIASHQKEADRYSYLKMIAEQYGATCTKHENKGFACSMNIYSPVLVAIIKEYVNGNDAHNKRLTNKVWKRDNEFLRQLAMGYLEGDGHYEESNNRYRLGFCRNTHLASDLRTICARLGYKIKLQEGIAKLNGKEFKKYGGEIRCNNTNTYNNKSDFAITKIVKGKNIGHFWDIVLEEEPHLFSDSSGMLIHNCMPSSATDRFTVDFEKVYFFTKSKKYWFEQQFEAHESKILNEFKPRKRGSKSIQSSLTPRSETAFANPYNSQGRNKRCVWTVNTKPYKEAHFAVFPDTLIEPMIKAGCPPGGTVLDMFFGSGTTGLVALRQNKNFIGIELNEEYIKIAEARLKPLMEQERLEI